jgi:3',5'-cyclic AMP phosphodiesterase CpdA/CheY-like chemotaxis protein
MKTTRSVNILWGEDEITHFEAYSSSVELYLEERGIAARFSHALNGAELIGQLATDKYDLLVTDLDMRRFQGSVAIPRIHERWPGLRIIVVSGHTTDDGVRSELEEWVRTKVIVAYCGADDDRSYCSAILTALTRRLPGLLHMADLHFGRFHAFDRDGLEKLFRRFASQIRQVGDIDIVLVSGDLASVGEDGEFDEARRFLRAVASHLDVGLERFVIVPGNHDITRFARQESRFSNYVDFLISFYGDMDYPNNGYQYYPALYDGAKKMLRPDAHRKPPGDLYSIAVFDDLRVIVVGLNSVLSDEASYDYGRIDRDQLLTVSDEIAKLSSPRDEYVRIATFHHNVMPVPNIKDDGHPERVVRNSTLVLHHLMEAGFDLVFHGHTHTSVAYQYTPFFMDPEGPSGRTISVVGTGTLSATDRDPSQSYYHLSTVRCFAGYGDRITSVVIQPHRLWDSNLSWRGGKPVTLHFDKLNPSRRHRGRTRRGER